MARSGGYQDNSERAAEKQQALMVVQPPRLPMPAEAASVGIDQGQWKALVDAVFPSARSVDGVMLALRYCKARRLDVFKRVVHVVPMWNSALGREVETVWPGIGEMRTTASRTGIHAGNDDCVFGRVMRRKFEATKRFQARGNNEPKSTSASCNEMEFPEWAQITVYKIVAGQRVPFVGPKVRFTEAFSGTKGLRVPNERWQQAPYQMLEKCAEAAALRRAFPEELGDEWTSDEMEGKVVAGIPTIDAQYHYVNEEEATGDPVDDHAESAEVAEDEDPQQELRDWWDEDTLKGFVTYMRNGCSKVTSVHLLEKEIAAQRERIDHLPEPEASQVSGYEAAARQRLAPTAADRQDSAVDERREQQAAAERVEPQPKPEQASEPAFVRNLRARVAEVELIVDLVELERVEQRSIDALPVEVALVCNQIIADKRAELTQP